MEQRNLEREKLKKEREEKRRMMEDEKLVGIVYCASLFGRSIYFIEMF